MLNRDGMINALSEKSGKVKDELQRYRATLYGMTLTKLAEHYRQETGNDPYTMKSPVPESAPPAPVPASA